MFKPDTGVEAYGIQCVLSFPKYCDIRCTLTLSTIVRRSDSRRRLVRIQGADFPVGRRRFTDINIYLDPEIKQK